MSEMQVLAERLLQLANDEGTAQIHDVAIEIARLVGFETRKAAEKDKEIEELRAALSVLLQEAESFSVSGVHFDEECMGHKGPAMARAALGL